MNSYLIPTTQLEPKAIVIHCWTSDLRREAEPEAEQGAPAPPPPFPGVNFFSHVKSENTIFLHVNNMETLVYFLNNSQVTKSGFSSKWKYYYFRKIEDRFNLWLFLINIRS